MVRREIERKAEEEAEEGDGGKEEGGTSTRWKKFSSVRSCARERERENLYPSLSRSLPRFLCFAGANWNLFTSTSATGIDRGQRKKVGLDAAN